MSLQSITITNASGDTAKILPDFGLNCYSYQVVREGEPIELLWSHSDLATGSERPSGSGIPLLFPFAGRITGTSFEYQGKEYPLEEGDGRGNAIHGFVMNRPWRVIQQSESKLTGQFQASVDEPELLDRWPADFCISVSYELREGGLISDVKIENPGDTPLPFSFATHAYFRLQLGDRNNTDESVITVPAEKAWELVDLRPTGKVTDIEGEPSLRSGIRHADCQFDNVFTGLRFDKGRCTTTIHDPTNGRTLKQTFGDAFEHCVVYNPPHREAMCMEPYTAMPDAFRLEEEGVRTGLRLLQPGESFQTSIEIRLE